MNEHLIIRNFGPITSLDIDIKPFTVFIGEQGSGKSTISKVLTICRDLLVQISIAKGDQEKVKEALREFGIFSFLKEDTYIEYSENCKIVFTKNKFSINKSEDYFTDKGITTLKKIRSIYSETKQSVKSIPQLQLLLNDLLNSFRPLLYIPAERIMATQLFPSMANILFSQIPLGKPILGYMSLFEKARNSSPVFSVPFLGVTYMFSNNKNMIEVDESHAKISLEEASSGIQSLLPLLLVFDYCSKQGYYNSFVIEEPEQNLFPSCQIELLRFILSQKGNDNKHVGLVITTHSPYMLSALNNYLYAAELANNPLVDKEEVDAVVPSNCQISIDDCAVYSLGKNLNGGEYCKSVISEETHLIDFNYLDKVSMDMGSEFDRLQNIYLNSLRKNRK